MIFYRTIGRVSLASWLIVPVVERLLGSIVDPAVETFDPLLRIHHNSNQLIKI